MLSGRLKYVCFAARVVVGVVFIVSACLKFSSIDSFELYLLSLDWFSFFWSSIFARLLILSEFVLGMALIAGVWHRIVNGATYAILGLFSLFLLYLVSQGYDGNCHCMGEQIDLPPIPSLLKNGVLALLVAFSSFGWKPSFHNPLVSKLLAAAALAVGVYIFVASPPDAFLIKRKQPVIHRDNLDNFLANDSVFQTSFADKPKVVLCMYSTGCHICKLSARKFQLLADHVNLPSSQVYQLFSVDVFNLNNDELVQRFFSENDAKPATYQLVDTEMLSMLVGTLPVYVVCEYGKVTSVFNYRLLSEDVIQSLIVK
ncbi:MAG: DoxX family membrane protein [Bacteroidales bacterium]|nr:DoxX family membrane protein [Candidatus Physcocola equi]